MKLLFLQKIKLCKVINNLANCERKSLIQENFPEQLKAKYLAGHNYLQIVECCKDRMYKKLEKILIKKSSILNETSK